MLFIYSVISYGFTSAKFVYPTRYPSLWHEESMARRVDGILFVESVSIEIFAEDTSL